jgi:hypothetical protein
MKTERILSLIIEYPKKLDTMLSYVILTLRKNGPDNGEYLIPFENLTN